MAGNRGLYCTYRIKGRNKWMDGTVLCGNRRVSLIDSRNNEIDSAPSNKISFEDESFLMEYHEVLCEEIAKVQNEQEKVTEQTVMDNELAEAEDTLKIDLVTEIEDSPSLNSRKLPLPKTKNELLEIFKHSR